MKVVLLMAVPVTLAVVFVVGLVQALYQLLRVPPVLVGVVVVILANAARTD
jgi:hypothetical protein